MFFQRDDFLKSHKKRSFYSTEIVEECLFVYLYHKQQAILLL